MPNFDQLEPNENATSSQLESHVSISYLDETSKKSYLHWIPNKTNPSHESYERSTAEYVSIK